MANDETIYILDQITPKAGTGEAFLKHYLDNYGPKARSWGMKLEHTWVNPPMWMEGELSNTLLIVWSVNGTAAYWGATQGARADAWTANFWLGVEPMIVTRTRSVVSEASNIASLTNV